MSSRDSMTSDRSKTIGSASQEAKGLFQELQSHATLLTCVVIVLWAIELANTLLGDRLNSFGIRPREIAGLQGIIFAPFLHGSWRHVISNTLPLIMLSGLILTKGAGEWVAVTVLGALASGVGTWLFGAPNTLHIGASGVIFSYFGYLVTRAWFERTIGSIFVSLVVLLTFGGMIWGISPIQRGISWEGHLFGLLGGVAIAWLVAGINRKANSRKF